METAAASTDGLPPETLKLAEAFVAAGDPAPTFDAAAAGAMAKRSCASDGGTYCDQFAKAAEAAAVDEEANLHAAIVAWVARTYTESELKALVAGARDPSLIEKGGQLALALPRLEAQALRAQPGLVRKHYCEAMGCPPLSTTAAPAARPQ